MTAVPHTYVSNLAALCSELEARGERVVRSGEVTAVSRRVDQHDSTIQLVWGPAQEQQGALYLVEVLPMLIAPPQVDELIRVLAFANAQLAAPGFQLRKQASGWKVAYSVCAYADHERKLSTRVVVEWLAEIRRVVAERLPELWALAPAPATNLVSNPVKSEFVEAATRATAKLQQVKPVVHAPLSAEQIGQLAQAFTRDLPRFGDRALTAKITDAGAQWFECARVLRVESAAPFPAQAAYAAWLPTGPVVLSGNPAGLAAVNAAERSGRASDPDLAVALASVSGAWVGASLMQEVRLNSVDDIPFRRANDADRAAEAELRQTFASQIVPPSVERLSDGVRLTLWVVSEAQLRRRISEVRDGAITVSEEVIAEVPAFPGKMWAMQNNRFVPVG